MDVEAVAAALDREATTVNERRLLVLSGARENCYVAVRTALDGAGISREKTTLVGPHDERAGSHDGLRCEHVDRNGASQLLGTTREAVVVDCHEGLYPNALGRVVGAVDGGGLFVLLVPDLDAWPTRRDEFDEKLAVPPFGVEDVTGRFRHRFVETLRAHPGIAIVDVDTGSVQRDGLTDPAPRFATEQSLAAVVEPSFPDAAYEACLTDDQVDAVCALECLTDSGQGVVVEADRGRGKSSAAGLAAGSLVAAGENVVVTAPGFQNAKQIFARSRELLDELDIEWVDEKDVGTEEESTPRHIETTDAGSIRFFEPPAAVERADDCDVLLVDEAAALPVRVLEGLLAADRVAFTTTVHGYEGAGRGFSVRFRDRLAESDHAITDVSMIEPIRYGPGDPVEVWAFNALLLDARPAVDPLVTDATPESVEYRTLDPDELLADEQRFREAFGLLVLAHYRTEPDDLARVLDAPNLGVHALCQDGHVVSVALLAREGGLSADRRARMYDGERIRGNMLPDVLTTQLRDEAAAIPAGWRVVRIATHHSVRTRGLGSTLLAAVRERADERGLDWLGVGYGATPGLLSFWDENGFSTVYLSTTRNATSGEYSAIMLDPLTPDGERLADRTATRFVRRIESVLTDALDDADPDVVRAALRATTPPVPFGERLDLSGWEWRVVVGAAYGPGLYDVSPRPFRRLALTYFLEDVPAADRLDERAERLLVLRVLQSRSWDDVERRLGFHSSRQCKRALGKAFRPLVDRYGDEVALEERARYV